MTADDSLQKKSANTVFGDEVPVTSGTEGHTAVENPASGNPSVISRRSLFIHGASTLAVLALMESPLFAQMWGAGEGEKVIPFLDQPPAPPQEVIQKYGELSKLDWQKLNAWITPDDQFFDVSHYNRPEIQAETWHLEIGGLVDRPLTFTLDDLKARPKRELVFTLECAGNNGFDWFVGAAANAKWAGTPLAPILKEAGIQANAVDVVFFGNDVGEEEVRGIRMKQNFSRSMSVEDALAPENMLCYEMNAKPLSYLHGFPVRFIAAGWYGIANVKWLKRIEVIDTRWAGRFMAKDYVTIREEPGEGGQTVWTQKVVGRWRLKSVTAKVTVKDGRYRIYGAAWGDPIERVEVCIDDGPWVRTTIDRGKDQKFAWKFWHLDWKNPTPGEHTITSRAIDQAGNVQPTMDDPIIAKKHTYWESNGQITRTIRLA